MGYQIEYRDGLAVRKTEQFRWGRVLLFAGVCFLLFSVLTMHFWPEGEEILQSWLYPGNAAETKTALHHMASRLREGTSLSEAVFVFCQEILNGAGNPT